ncbi:MAG TPA: NRDE family protein [Streptosporangiaceae bacterium]|jgi:hypothetical protein
MCTAIVSVEPGAPLLLAGIRDELVDRAWQPPAEHWPDYPGILGGRDLLAGGTWLAVDPPARRAACVLNGRGRPAAPDARRSRGVLPLQAAAGGRPGPGGLASFDPFHLLTVTPSAATLDSWDGEQHTERELGPGLHMIVNSGLAGSPGVVAGREAGPAAGRGAVAGQGAAAGRGVAARSAAGRDLEVARIAHFLPRLTAAERPGPRPGAPAPLAWGAWLPLLNGDGLDPADPRSLIVRRDLGDGRIWGTTSISLVALSARGVRYDFTGTPGDPRAWDPVPDSSHAPESS